MLRIYFLLQWFHLSDPAVEEALYDCCPVSFSMRAAQLTAGQMQVKSSRLLLPILP